MANFSKVAYIVKPRTSVNAMFCETLYNEEEVYQAYLLYASLHGLSTDEDDVRERIANYVLRNQPDELIDAAILAVSEDRIVAPPDIILEHWGKSRVYELQMLLTGGWRHEVSENWFDAGCRFSLERPVRLCHFWTCLEPNAVLPDNVGSGSRCSLRLADDGQVRVIHRRQVYLGAVPQPLASEIVATIDENINYLALIDTVQPLCRLLVTRALPNVPVADVIEYAANAFTTPRNKC